MLAFIDSAELDADGFLELKCGKLRKVEALELQMAIVDIDREGH